MQKPPFLSPGDKVAIVAPAKRLQSELHEGVELLKSWGLEVALGRHVFSQSNLFAGDDQERLADLQQFMDDPDVRAIIMARGGYGTTRILDRLDWSKYEESPKWICGFSDITVLLQRIVNNGHQAIHSTVGVLLGKEEHKESDESLRRVLFGQELDYHFNSTILNRKGSAEGRIIGGNLSMICNSIGTSSEVDTRNNILFIEDVGEYIYHLDRMLVQLKRAGKFDHLEGLIVGHFTSMKDHQDTFGLTTEEVILHQCKDYSFPIAFGFPTGHEAPNLALYVGAPALMSVDDYSAQLEYKSSE